MMDQEGNIRVSRDFAKFVQSQQASQVEENNDWAGLLAEWLRNLDSLYQQVAAFLEDFRREGSISYDYMPIELTEEDLGTYSAPRMDIKIGRQTVYLEPLGTMLIACRGRVDVVGSVGRAQLLLIDTKAETASDLIHVSVSISSRNKVSSMHNSIEEPTEWAWKIVSRTPIYKFEPIQKDSFFQVLMEVANA